MTVASVAPDRSDTTRDTVMGNNDWNIDTAHTAINFSVRHMVISKVRGRFAKYSGTIRLDDGDVTRSSVDVSIDASSIDTGVADRDTHLRSPDFFDVENFSELRFRSKRIEQIEKTRYRVIGDLSIRGVTREVSLDAEYGGRATDPWGNERVGFVAKTTIDRSDFGLTWNQALEAGGILVGDRVEIDLDVEAVRAAAQSVA
nr:YceI family protein [Labilithrix luteola]